MRNPFGGNFTRSACNTSPCRSEPTTRRAWFITAGVGLFLLQGAGSGASAQDSADAATTTTVVQVWSAQVVATEDLGKVATESVATSVTPVSTTSPRPTSTTKKPRRTKTSAPTTTTGGSPSTIVRLLPSTTRQAAAPASDAPSTSAGKTPPKKATTTTSVARLAAGPTSKDVPAASSSGSSLDEAFAKLRHCESGNRYSLNTGNGYYGAYQFSLSTWKRLGYPGYPHEASPSMQDEAARALQAKSGWGQWPACARKLGLR